MKNRISVLVVEESQTFSMYLAILLQRIGFKSLRVSQPESAKFVLSRGFTDCLIIGDQSGPEATHEIVQELSARIPGNTIPIIVVSRHCDPAEQQACLDAGCQDYLLKPVQPKQLHDALYASINPFPEKRLNLRSQVDMMAEVSVDNGPSQTCRVLTLSCGGALVAYPQTLLTGSEVSLTLRLDNTRLHLAGSVLYNLIHVEEKVPRAFGLLFHQVSPAHADRIEDYLQTTLDECRLIATTTGSTPHYREAAAS